MIVKLQSFQRFVSSSILAPRVRDVDQEGSAGPAQLAGAAVRVLLGVVHLLSQRVVDLVLVGGLKP